MNKLFVILGAFVLAACPGSQTPTETKSTGLETGSGKTDKPQEPVSDLVGKCEPHKLPKTAWQPSKSQLRGALEQSQEDMRRFFEGGSVSFAKGKLLEAAAACVKARNATTFDMEVCGDTTTTGKRSCYKLNVHSLDWKGRHWVSIYYNYGNDSMVDIYEIRDDKAQSYCAAFTPQFHKQCNDTDGGSSDTSCAKLEADWKSMPETVRMALCFPGQD